MPVSYRDIAADLRQQISEGRYMPGDKLPMLTELQAQYGAGYQTVRSAISLLEQEGLVVAVRRRGTIVRERPEKRRITRSRQVFRDEIGYYFDPTAQPWVALEPPTLRWGIVPVDLAALMGLPTGSEVLVRDRVMGDPRAGSQSSWPPVTCRPTSLEELDSQRPTRGQEASMTAWRRWATAPSAGAKVFPPACPRPKRQRRCTSQPTSAFPSCVSFE